MLLNRETVLTTCSISSRKTASKLSKMLDAPSSPSLRFLGPVILRSTATEFLGKG